ncbi:DUF1016 domain-containing protein [Candidatus Poribacteria bacterium]|nr:DUF1016 domain-containing protein [Candidatus Poribacteria bacterium]
MKNRKPETNDFYTRIRRIIKTARSNILRAANTEMVIAYWYIGKEIVEEEQKGNKRASYGKSLLSNLSKKLTFDFGKGFDESNLRNIRFFYLIYPKCDALRHELSWTHYRILMRIENPEARLLYESDLEQALIDNLSKFLLELGNGFTFVGRQKRITLDGDHFYIDLVFYHTILKCYVLIDLKVGKLTHQDIGQMQMYINYYDREIKQSDDNPTVGLLLCEDKKEAVVRYTLSEKNKQIFASRYKLYLPTEKELRNELNRERKLMMVHKNKS